VFRADGVSQLHLGGLLGGAWGALIICHLIDILFGQNRFGAVDHMPEGFKFAPLYC
jgi:DNA-binding HxlR family transcriptional regulator